MTHVGFDFYEDFSKPLIKFLLKNKFNLFNYEPIFYSFIPNFLFCNPRNSNNKSEELETLLSSKTLINKTEKTYTDKLR